MLFPTGKQHVSYSEVKLWKECSYRHKLAYVDKLQVYEDNPYADFGTAVHNAIENYLLSKTMDIEKCTEDIQTAWDQKNYRGEEYLEKMANQKWYKDLPVETWQNYAKVVLDKFPAWMDEAFPNWEIVSAEYALYENIENSEINFKGFVDCLIKCDPPRGKTPIYWVIDWKTTGPAGWMYKKKRDFLALAQVGLYKKYISKKLNIPIKDIRCAYVFLKRGAKPEKCIEKFTVSVGPKFITKADKMVYSMIKSVENGISLRNYNSCKFCPFSNSEHCNGQSW